MTLHQNCHPFMLQTDDLFLALKWKIQEIGSPLDEIVLFSVHKCYIIIGHCDIIRELGNHCYAGLLYLEITWMAIAQIPDPPKKIVL